MTLPGGTFNKQRAEAENVETRDNGNIIMRLFMDNNTEKRIENPYIPMAFEANSYLAVPPRGIRFAAAPA